jgi:hypothetical protein
MAKKGKEYKAIEFNCDGCGKINAVDEEVWQSSKGRQMCNSCMFEPLNVLQKVFFAKDFKKAKEIIKEFDEGFDESFLGIEYV